MAARYVMILIDRRQVLGRAWLPAAAPLAAVLLALGLLSAPQSAYEIPKGVAQAVPFTVVRGIVDLRCSSCHAARPIDKAFTAPPSGLSFDTATELAARAAMIKASVSVTRTMPPGNSTRMTEEERALLVNWADRGARTN
jgi:uncharacterized membrane protein